MMFHHSNFGNLARNGIGLYGVDPRGEENPELRQAMSLYTKVSMIKEIHKGDKVGYGMTYEASGDERIATLPIGASRENKISFSFGSILLIRFLYSSSSTYERLSISIVPPIILKFLMTRIPSFFHSGVE